MTLRALRRLVDTRSHGVDGNVDAVATDKASEVRMLQYGNNLRAAYHHSLDTHELVDMARFEVPHPLCIHEAESTDFHLSGGAHKYTARESVFMSKKAVVGYHMRWRRIPVVLSKLLLDHEIEDR